MHPVRRQTTLQARAVTRDAERREPRLGGQRGSAQMREWVAHEDQWAVRRSIRGFRPIMRRLVDTPADSGRLFQSFRWPIRRRSNSAAKRPIECAYCARERWNDAWLLRRRLLLPPWRSASFLIVSRQVHRHSASDGRVWRCCCGSGRISRESGMVRLQRLLDLPSLISERSGCMSELGRAGGRGRSSSRGVRE